MSSRAIKFRALTQNDHRLFFEALGEFGKDFQAIQTYMSQKCGKGNSKSSENKSNDNQEKKDQDKKDEDKKREQIRNFYNKLYGKLSQLIVKLDDRVEKVNQELYLLINYGEIWKKLGFKFKFNNKTKRLLEELIFKGFTTLRFQNKNVRLRTPPCKALKKINEIGVDEKVKVVTTRELPKDVLVEFHPATNRDWLIVQSMSQNPRLRARLAIQKRMSNILEFLENKWNISQDKLNRTVDAWLKVPPTNSQTLDEAHMQQTKKTSSINGHSIENPQNLLNNNNGASSEQQPTATSQSNDTKPRLRLKPSSQHELNEVNITRVIPDNHLDLSLNAYISRMGDLKSKDLETTGKNMNNSNNSINTPQNMSGEDLIADGSELHHQSAMLSSSRLPLSLATPDSSILLETSITSDQPSIAQARRHLNILQSIAGSFEGCENSRTCTDDTTQDKSNHPLPNITPTTTPTITINQPVVANNEDNRSKVNSPSIEPMNVDSQSVDFQIPKNLTLGDWFKMTGHDCGDEANHAFPVNQTTNSETAKATTSATNSNSNCNKEDALNDNHNHNNDDGDINDQAAATTSITTAGTSTALTTNNNNQMIEMKRIAEGWTRQDDSMTIGELYLAFKCPEKIVLEYEFEQYTQPNQQYILLFKLLTAASLSLAQIRNNNAQNNNTCQKHDQQHQQQQQPSAKLKRRKGPTNSNAMTIHDIEATNQRVEEALKQLQPTRLCRRAR